MTLKVAERGQVPPFIVMDVMRAAAEREATGKDGAALGGGTTKHAGAGTGARRR